MGFVWTRRTALPQLIQRADIRKKRLQYLTDYVQILEEGQYKIVYQDETWIFKRGSHKTFEWHNGDARACSIKSDANGARYIVAHVGGRDGFVPGAAFLRCSSKKPSLHDDYHGDMNGPVFINYLSTQVLPNLLKPTVIVMDNAPYHSTQVSICIK